MFSVSAKVIVRKKDRPDTSATVTKAHGTLLDYDILYPTGEMEEKVPADQLRDMRVRFRAAV